MTSSAKFFIDNYKFTIVVMIGLVVFGLNGLFGLNAESFPTVNIGSAIISTAYPGASAEDIEVKITKPIEDEIRTVQGLKEVKSVSQAGFSKIVTIVDIDHYSAEKVIAELQRAVERTPDLPTDLPSPPQFLEVKSDEFPVIELAVVGTNENRLRDKVAYLLSEELEDNKSIARVLMTGFRDRQFNIYVDQSKLEQFHVGLNEVTQRVAAQNLTIPAGNIESDKNLKILRIEGKVKSARELERLVIRSNFSGERVLLGDVATVEDGEEDATTLALFEGEPATFLTIAKKGGADIVTLSNQVKQVIKEFEGKYQGQLKFVVYSDEGLRVGKRVAVLSSNSFAGLILVIFFLMVFLPGRVGIMTALSLPLSVFATFGLFASNGMTLNTISILALVISIGMLVDNAVVISENFVRLKEEGMDGREAALQSVSSLWLPITATALTTIAAFLPMLVTKGVMGQFIKGIPIVVTTALLLSLLESFYLLPVRLLADKAHSKNRIHRPDWFSRLTDVRFPKLVAWLLDRRYFIVGLFTSIIVGSLLMMVFVNKLDMFPADQTEFYLARVELARDSRIEETEKILAQISKETRNLLGDSILHVTAKAGISETDFTDPKSQSGEKVGMVILFMTEEAKNSLATNDVLEKLRTIKIDSSVSVTYEAVVNGPPIGHPVTAVFRSNSVQNLTEVSHAVQEALKGIPGIFDVQVNDVYGADEVQIEIDQQRAAQLGLDLATVGTSVRVAIAGERVGDVNIDNRDVNYFVRLKDEDRRAINSLASLRIMDRTGNLIPLAQVAKLVDRPPSPQINRTDYKRAKTVTANINNDLITSVHANKIVRDVFEKKLAAKYKNVSLKFGGEGERTQESLESLFQALILSIIGIFALLVFMFKSYIRPLIILTTIPLGLVGVSISFFIHNRPLSFLAMIGIVGLGGIIVNSGIVLISFIEQMRSESPRESLRTILVRATSLRLRAVVVTSLTTICGLLPTAYGIGGNDEFIIPMTLGMAWGLTSGTILSLLWVPCAYAITEDFSLWFQRFFGQKGVTTVTVPTDSNGRNVNEATL